jgi:very-short-patch-repair endonuclease
MNARLLALARAQGGVFAAAQAERVGVPSASLSRLVRAGALVRPRRAAYILGEAYAGLSPDDRYRLRVRAVLLTRPRRDCASHHGAAALHEVALFGVNLTRIDVCSRVETSNVVNGLRVHPTPQGAAVVLVRGALAMAPAIAAVQVAAASGVVSGVCAMDAAVHSGLCTVPDLEDALALVPPGRRARAQAAVRLVDPACESVGETRTRLLLRDLGLSVESQRVLADARGFVGRVDFLVAGRVVVEFDGMAKYGGREGAVALAAEKARESRLVDLGYEVVRIIWSDLEDPAEVARRIRVALARSLAREARR